MYFPNDGLLITIFGGVVHHCPFIHAPLIKGDVMWKESHKTHTQKTTNCSNCCCTSSVWQETPVLNVRVHRKMVGCHVVDFESSFLCFGSRFVVFSLRNPVLN